MNADDRRLFWIAFLAALSAQESGNDPTRVRFHPYDGDVHRPTYRRGLFQIAIESAHRRDYGCMLARAAGLTDPQKNIECAVKILDRKLTHDGAIARDQKGRVAGAARFWASLKIEAARETIAADTRRLSVCAVP